MDLNIKERDMFVMTNLNDRIDKLIELNIMHEKEREEAKFLVENFYIENQNLKKELNLLRDDDTKYFNEDIAELKIELDKSNEITVNLNLELQNKNLILKNLTAELETSKFKIESFNSQIIELKSQIQDLTEKQGESKAKLKRFKRLKKYLLSSDMMKLRNTLATKNDHEKVTALQLMKNQCSRLERFYVQSLTNIKKARIEIDDSLSEINYKISDQVEISNFNLSLKSITIKSKARYALDISGWILKIVNTFETELISYQFEKFSNFPACGEINLWSINASKGHHKPPRDIIMHVDRDQSDEAFIWLLTTNDLICLLYDNNMNVVARKAISIVNGAVK